MTHSTIAPPALPPGAPAAARTVTALLGRLRHGQLTVEWPDGTRHHFGRAGAPQAFVHLKNWNPCVAALKSGDIGFAESYIAGDWSTPQLADLLRVLLRNRQAIDDIFYGHWWGRLAYRVRHLLNRNTRANSRRNIHAHYDLGNDFYALWLDETMNYSSACFPPEGGGLVDAQWAKVNRVLDQAGVRPGDRVLEIGCGWGALAEAATARRGASVVGVTLSTEQLGWAQDRMARLGTSERADLRLQDYRDIADAPFDAICSVEMVEAVGREYWPTYFRTVQRLLKPGGRACIQSIVIADAHFERYLRSTDFIQQYIFPGGCLPSPSAFVREAEAAGLVVEDRFAFGRDYAETLRQWRARFLREESRVRALGFDDRFMRIWEFYLAYCEAAFDEGSTDVMQFTLRKPG